MGSKNPEWSYSQCLRHAFLTGAGYGDLEKISEDDLRRWTSYDPPKVGCFETMDKHFETMRLDAKLMEEATAKIEELRAERDSLKAALRDDAECVIVDRSLLEAACKELRTWKVDKGGDDQVVLNLEAALGKWAQ